jgi:pyruvate formate lyase activating enzyme
MECGLVFNIQRYSVNDGPGIRTTVFLKGCPLCCAWCHNPEGMQPRPEIVVVESRCRVCGECREACPLADTTAGEGPLPPRNADCLQCGACVDACPTGARQMVGRVLSVDEVLREALKDRVFYDDSGGGITVSGGEPLAQPRFLLALLEACRGAALQAVLDTTGFGGLEHLLAAARLSDLVLYDLKAFDADLHLRLTGVSNRRILENLKSLDREHGNVWIRLPIVPGFNDNPNDLRRLAEFVGGLRCVTRVSLLPFHRTGLHKFARLGLRHGLDGVETPSAEVMASVQGVFKGLGVPTSIGG